MKKCSYCQHEFEGSPRYCPNCGRVNYDDVIHNMSWVRQSIDSGHATQDDYAFINAVKKDVASANSNAKPSDYRTPLEKILDSPLWWIVILATDALAIWGNLNIFLSFLLLGICLFISGLISTRKRLWGKMEIYSIFLLIGGILAIGYALFTGIASLFGY